MSIEIEAAIAALTPEKKADHDQCISEGYKDEHCRICNRIFLAHHHFVYCFIPPCPMRSKKSVLEMLLGLEKEDTAP